MHERCPALQDALAQVAPVAQMADVTQMADMAEVAPEGVAEDVAEMAALAARV